MRIEERLQDVGGIFQRHASLAQVELLYGLAKSKQGWRVIVPLTDDTLVEEKPRQCNSYHQYAKFSRQTIACLVENPFSGEAVGGDTPGGPVNEWECISDHRGGRAQSRARSPNSGLQKTHY